MTPAEITTVEACAAELEEVAQDLRRSHTNPGAPGDWLGDDAARADYNGLMRLAGDARAMVERWKAAT